MIHANDTEKALVPYSSQNDFKTNFFESTNNNLILETEYTRLRRVYLFCKSRYKTYLFFLSLFFLLSTFSCCLYFERSGYGDEWSLNVVKKFEQHGYNFPFIVTIFSWVLAYRLLSFVFSFSFLSTITAFICSCRVFFTSSYFFIAIITRFENASFFSAVAFVILNAIITFADVLFYTEAKKFYKLSCSKPIVIVFYALGFFIYIGLVLFLFYQQLLLAASVL